MIDYNIIHSGMVALLALLGTLLVSLAVMIYDRASGTVFILRPEKVKDNDNKKMDNIDDVFPWEKTVLLKYVAKAPWLFLSFIASSIALITFGIDLCWVRIFSVLIYIFTILFISYRIWLLGNWMYAQADITANDTYRQKTKYKFLESLSNDSDLVSIWSITWNNISPTNPYQSKYLKIFLEQVNKISGSSNIWRYIDVFVQNMNLGNIDVTGPDMIQLLVEYSISVFDKKNIDELPIKTAKRKILESLLTIQLIGDDSLLCFTFDVVEKVISKSNDRGDIMRGFAGLFFSAIDKSNINNDKISRIFSCFPHTEYGVSTLLNKNNKTTQVKDAQIWLQAFVYWFKENNKRKYLLSSDNTDALINDNRIDAVTKGFLGDGYFMELGEKIFGDMLLFYGVKGFAPDEGEKTIEDSLVRLFVNTQRGFMQYDAVTIDSIPIGNEPAETRLKHTLEAFDNKSKQNDINSIIILRYVFPLSNCDHVEKVLAAIKSYGEKICNKKDDIRTFRLKRLKYDFELIKNFNKTNQNNIK